ncbi:MAG: hypothetical protein KDB23_17515 [Planctomycetales bacterium]|nr:hypothetical protein [Planctomycetales bacterium]
MARTSSTRYDFTAALVAKSALHVGSGFGNEVTDMALATDGQGRLYIPGTSWAGVLRKCCAHVCQRLADLATPVDDLVNDLWGYQERDSGQAARIVVQDTELPEDAAVEIRDHVGIDRRWGVAAETIKFDRAVISAGTQLVLRLHVECSDSRQAETVEYFLQSLAAAFQQSHIRIGAAKSRGLGEVTLADAPAASVSIVRHELGTRAGILGLARLLHSKAPSAASKQVVIDTAHAVAADQSIQCSIVWSPRGALMVKASADGLDVDSVPLVDATRRLLIPGSSIKGAFRNQAERIIRTIRKVPINHEEDPKQRFLSYLQSPDLELVHYLFGARSGQATPGATAAVWFSDCQSVDAIPPELWARINGTQGGNDARDERAIRQVLDDSTNQATSMQPKRWRIAQHVAIDRWLGGAATGLLFNVLEPRAVEWEPIRFNVNLDVLPDDDQLVSASLTLLILVLRDFELGKIPIGFGTNRGMGDIETAGAEIQVSGVADDHPLAHFKQVESFALNKLPRELQQPMKQHWQSYWSGAAAVEAT